MAVHDEVLSDAEIERLFRGADEWLRSRSRGIPRRGTVAWARDRLLSHGVVVEWLCAAALEAGRRQATHFVDALLDHADVVLEPGWRGSSLSSACADSLEVLLARGAPVSKALSRVVQSRHVALRYAVASALSPHAPGALDVLAALSQDQDSETRTTAQKRLAEVQVVNFWVGLFDSDPLARLAPPERDSLGADIAQLVQFANLSLYERARQDPEPFFERVARLPDDLALEFVERFANTDKSLTFTPRLLREFVRRPNATALFVRLLTTPIHSAQVGDAQMLAIQLPSWLSSASAADVRRLAEGLAEHLLERPLRVEDERELLLSVLPRLWRDGMDAERLVSGLSQLWADPGTDLDDDPRISALFDALAHDQATVQRELFRLLEMVERLPYLGRSIEPALRALPPEVLQALVDKYGKANSPLRGLALELSVPLTQAEGQYRVRSLLDDAAFRQRLLSDGPFRDRFEGVLRQALLEGRLEIVEAGSVMAKWEEAPPAAWSIFRALQRRALDDIDGKDLHHVLSARPAGVWQDEDLELLCALVERLKVIADQPRRENFFMYRLLTTIVAGDDPRVAHLADEVVVLASAGLELLLPSGLVAYEQYCARLGRTPKAYTFRDDHFDDEED